MKALIFLLLLSQSPVMANSMTDSTAPGLGGGSLTTNDIESISWKDSSLSVASAVKLAMVSADETGINFIEMTNGEIYYAHEIDHVIYTKEGRSKLKKAFMDAGDSGLAGFDGAFGIDAATWDSMMAGGDGSGGG